MLKYYVVALALKVLSYNSLTRNFYRFLANKKRQYLPSTDDISWKYFFRTEKLFALLRENNILHDNMSIFEFGHAANLCTVFAHFSCGVIDFKHLIRRDSAI